ncbi:hypothetical protein E4U58_005463 [Claviceps cyperi]|nr:hypothetical protein E4U58_005463 [Claviceps cyperi]
MMQPHSEDMQTKGPNSTAGDGSDISLPKHNCPINDKAEQEGEKSSSSYESQKNGDSAPCAFPQFMQLGESRNLALRQYPDELAVIAGVADGIVRFRKETDIISLRDWESYGKYTMPDFSDKIENLALAPIRVPYRH